MKSPARRRTTKKKLYASFSGGSSKSKRSPEFATFSGGSSRKNKKTKLVRKRRKTQRGGFIGGILASIAVPFALKALGLTG